MREESEGKDGYRSERRKGREEGKVEREGKKGRVGRVAVGRREGGKVT